MGKKNLSPQFILYITGEGDCLKRFYCIFTYFDSSMILFSAIFFSLFAIDGSITFSLLIDFDKSTFLGIFMFASSINRCFRQVTKNPFLLSEEVIYESQTDSSGAWGGGRGEGGGGCNPIQQLIA